MSDQKKIRTVIRALCISCAVLASSVWGQERAWEFNKGFSSNQRTLTSQLNQWPEDLVYSLDLNGAAFKQRQSLSLPLPSGRSMSVKPTWKQGQGNTDFVEFYSSRDFRSLDRDHPTGHGSLTVSPAGIFGELYTDEGWFEITTDRSGTWMARLDDHRINLDHQCGFNLAEHGPDPQSGGEVTASKRGLVSEPSDSTVHQIDVLVLFGEDMKVRYPGDLLLARLAHYFNIANQALANTELTNVVIRMVGAEFTDYEPRQTSSFQNSDAVGAMRVAVNPASDPAIINPSFQNLSAIRAEYGADIITFILTADIETRGSCGVAFVPESPSSSNPSPEVTPEMGVQVINDGFTNWSVCQTTVFAHELGHNIGMFHQASSLAEAETYNYAMVVRDLFGTIMRSFGSADPNRYFGMRAFSNPNMTCAGEPCGLMPTDTAAGADGYKLISSMAPVIASYQAAQDNVVLTPFEKAMPDTDGDGINDWEDTTPFGIFPPAVENDWRPRRLVSGNEISSFDLLVSGTDDRVYGWRLGQATPAQSMGVLIEAEPAGFPDLRPAFTEYSSIAVQSDGLLFALSGGSVKTYSRLTGEEISTFRGPRYSTGTTELLPDGFPRALDISRDGSLLVVMNHNVGFEYGARLTFYDLTDHANEGQYHLTSPTVEGVVNNWRDVAISDDGTFVTTIHDLEQPAIHIYASGPDPFNPTESIFQHNRSQSIADVDSPRALAISLDSSLSEIVMFVLDEATQKIYKRVDSDANGVQTKLFIDGSSVISPVELMTNIRDIAIGPDGDLYILDQGSRSISRFSVDGVFIEYVVGPDAPELDQAQRMTFSRAFVDDEVFGDQFIGDP